VRALVASGPGELTLADRPRPTANEGEVVVDVAWAAICHTDYFLLDGRHPAANYPIVPGHEFSGSISLVGEGVSASRVGEPVAIVTQVGCGSCVACAGDRVGRCPDVRELGSNVDGGWQEQVVVPAKAARPLPATLSLLEAALTEPSANAYALVGAAHLARGDRIAVIGPGPIGILAIQYARLHDPARLVMVGLEGDSARLALAVELGADEGLAAPTPEEVIDALGGPADVVLQCAPAVSATSAALDLAGRGGRVVIEGFAAIPDAIPNSPDRLVLHEISLLGVRGWRISDFDAALALNSRHLIDVASLVTHRFDLSEFEQALQQAADHESGVGRVVFSIAGTAERQPQASHAVGVRA
jgi:L-iditol 2-dehydrogenase